MTVGIGLMILKTSKETTSIFIAPSTPLITKLPTSNFKETSSTRSLDPIEHPLLHFVPNAKEIKEIVFYFKPRKALGPDSLHPLFFQKYWESVGPQII